MALKYDRDKLILYLQEQTDISPDTYDGSYELLRETVGCYAALNDYSAVNYLDLNLVYLMVIITTRHSIDRKKESVRASHLPDADKSRLIALLDNVWQRALGGGYVNREAEEPVVGMFGTGFYSFQNKTNDKCARDFIRMCVDVLLNHSGNFLSE